MNNEHFSLGYINFADSKCQEHVPIRGHPEGSMPHGAPADAIVWHEKDRRAYFMCAGCADHNVKNRGGKLVASGNFTAFYMLYKYQGQRAQQLAARLKEQAKSGSAQK